MRSEDRHDVLEQDARLGEVLELPQRRPQLYFKTGEFGGTGGSGGGLSSLGGILQARVVLAGLTSRRVKLWMWSGSRRIGLGGWWVRGGGRLIRALRARRRVVRMAVGRMGVKGDRLGGHGGLEVQALAHMWVAHVGLAQNRKILEDAVSSQRQRLHVGCSNGVRLAMR